MKNFLTETAMVAAAGLVCCWLRLRGRAEQAACVWADLCEELAERNLEALRAEYKRNNS